MIGLVSLENKKK